MNFVVSSQKTFYNSRNCISQIKMLPICDIPLLLLLVENYFALILTMNPTNSPYSSSQHRRGQSGLNVNAPPFYGFLPDDPFEQKGKRLPKFKLERPLPIVLPERHSIFEFETEKVPRMDSRREQQDGIDEIFSKPPVPRPSKLDQEKNDSEKSSSHYSPNTIIVQRSPAIASGVSEREMKGDKSRPTDKDEADLATESTKKVNMEVGVSKQPLEKKKQPSEGKQQTCKPEGSTNKPIVIHPIETVSKMGELDAITFGSISGADLAGIKDRRNPETKQQQKSIEQSSFVENIKMPTKTLTCDNQGKKLCHQQESSSSSAKSERTPMSDTAKKIGAKSPIQVPKERGGVQGRREQNSSAQRDKGKRLHKSTESQPLPLPSERQDDEQEHSVPKDSSSSSLSTAFSPVISSAASAAISPSIASSHSTSPIQKGTENPSELLVEQAAGMSQGKQVLQVKEDGTNESVEGAGESDDKKDDQSKGSAQDVKRRKKKKKKATIATDNSNKKKGKADEKEEDRELEKQMKEAEKERKVMEQNSKRLLKQAFQAALKQSLSERSSMNNQRASLIKKLNQDAIWNPADAAKAVQRKELLATFNLVVDLANDIMVMQHECQKLVYPSEEREQKLLVLKNNYHNFMDFLQNFALNYGNQIGQPLSPYTFFADILQLFQPILVGEEGKVKDMIVVVLNCLFFLDKNGGLLNSKEHDKQLLVLDKLLQNISKLDELINTYYDRQQTKVLKLGVQGVHTARRNVEDWYQQNMQHELREAIGYLCVGVEKFEGEGKEAVKSKMNRANHCLKKFALVLPHRQKQILSAVDTISKLFNLPKLQRSEGSSSRSAFAKSNAEQQVLMTWIISIIRQINHMNDLYEVCLQQQFESAAKREQKLWELKRNHLKLMGMLEDFAMKFGEKYGKSELLSGYTHFDEILNWIGQLQPDLLGGEAGVKTMNAIVRDSLCYLDENGTHLNEQGKQLMVLDELLQNFSKLDGLIIKYNDADKKNKEDSKLGGSEEKATALKELEDWYQQHVETELYEAIGYMYIVVKKRAGEDKTRKLKIGQSGQCLLEFILVLPHRKEQILNAVETISKLLDLPVFKHLSDIGGSRSGEFEITVPLSKLGQHIRPFVANSPAISSSSSQTHPPNITTFDKSGAVSFKVPKTPNEPEDPKTPREFEEPKTMSELVGPMTAEQQQLKAEIIQAILELHSINTNCEDDTLPKFIKRNKLLRLGPVYEELMKKLESFTDRFGIVRKWNGNAYYGEIFKWIGITIMTEEGQDITEDIMRKSVALMDRHDQTKFGKLLESVSQLETLLAEYELVHSQDLGESNESRELFKQMETLYMFFLDTQLREALSFQFIGMRKTFLSSHVRVERMRKCVANDGLESLTVAMREQGTPGQRKGQFELAQKTLLNFFDKWTDKLETQIRADLPGYVAKILGIKEESNVKMKEKKGKSKANKKKEGKDKKNSLNLEQLADICIKRDAKIQVEFLEQGLITISELLDGGWKPSIHLVTGSSNIKKGKAKVEKEGEITDDEGTDEEAEELVNLFNWKQVLEDVRKLIRYMQLLSSLEETEWDVYKKVDGLHVHLRVWTILFEDNISPILAKWNDQLRNRMPPKDQQSDENNMKGILEILAIQLDNFLTQHGQEANGRRVKSALETLVSMNRQNEMQHRNMHLRSLLAKYGSNKVDDDGSHSNTCSCKRFDDLFLD